MIRNRWREQNISLLHAFGKATLVNNTHNKALAFDHGRKIFPKCPKVITLTKMLCSVFLMHML